jgi:uncharacterized protein (DUF2147 family)
MFQTVRSCFAALPAFAFSIQAGVGVAALVGTPGLSHAEDAKPIPPDGIWYDGKSSAIIKFQPCKTGYCGTVVWLKEPTTADGSPMVDTANPDPAKRKRPIIGLEIFSGMVPEEDHWKGKAYNADDGKTYDITFTVKTDKEPNDKADVRGCVLRILCGTETFSRAPEVPGGDPTASADAAGAAGKAKHIKKDTAHK